MDSAAAVWVAAIAACSGLAAQLVNTYVTWRNRKWEAEDRERLARDLRAAREALAKQLAESEQRKDDAIAKLAEAHRDMATALRESERDKTDAIERVAAEQREMTRITQQKIDENTEISTRAFHEANSVNLKIKSLGVELLEGEGKPQKPH